MKILPKHDVIQGEDSSASFDDGFYLATSVRNDEMACPHCRKMGSLFDICKEEKLSTGETVEVRGFSCAECEKDWYSVDAFLKLQTDRSIKYGQMPEWMKYERKVNTLGQFEGATRVAIH